MLDMTQNSSRFQYFSHLLIQLLNFFTGQENRGVVDCDSGKNGTKIMRFLSMQLSGLSVFYVEVLGADAGCKDWLAPVALDCLVIGVVVSCCKMHIKNRYCPR